MSSQHPIIANVVVAPTDSTASSPAISFGADNINNSGTGIYGSFGTIKMALSGAQALTLDSNGLGVGAAASSVYIFLGAGAPVDGTTGLNFAGTGSLYIATTAGKLYIQTSLISTPAWVVVGAQT